MKVRREDLTEVVEGLRKLGGKEESPPKGVYKRFKFDEGIVQLYDSGSIVFGGKGKEKLKRKVEGKLLEKLLEKRKFPIVGCDEAGKGEFFGPLVVACVWADEKGYRELLKLGVKDSKKLGKEKVKELSDKITSLLHGKVKVVWPEKYNELYRKYKNQNRILEEVYLEALKELLRKLKAKEVVVDKFSYNLKPLLEKEFPEVKFKVITKGEDEPAVAAAAIMAKAVRLKALEKLSKKLGFPVKEGNLSNRELLSKIPENLRYKFVKEHFNVKGEES
ncbi:ribonuclease HIII [Thermovibrio sp.]